MTSISQSFELYLAKLDKTLVCVMSEDVLIYQGISITFDRENLKNAMATLLCLTGLAQHLS